MLFKGQLYKCQVKEIKPVYVEFIADFMKQVFKEANGKTKTANDERVNGWETKERHTIAS